MNSSRLTTTTFFNSEGLLSFKSRCRDFAILPLQEIASRLREGRALPEGACAITFDDGWRDNIDHALPVLEGKGVPATIFAVTSRVGTLGAFWPDEVSRILSARSSSDGRALVKQIGVEVASGEALQATLAFLKEASEAERPARLERLWEAASHELDTARELLDWEELETLSRRGVDIESHGVSHAILTGLPMDEVRRELEHALVALRERGLGRHGLFAYPSGGFDAGIAKLAKDVGYRVAVTTQPGLVSAATNPMTLPRIGIHQDISSTRAEFLRWVPGEVRPIEGLATR